MPASTSKSNNQTQIERRHLHRDKIDKDFKRQELHNKEIATSSSANGEMRVMMTRCVAEAWEIFCRDKTDVVIRSFRCLGIALPIDGSCDEELSIKGLETTSLLVALKDWKTQGVTVDSPSNSGDDSDSNSSGPDENLLEDFTVSGPTPPLRGQKSRMQCRTRGAVRGTQQNVVNHDISSDLEDKSPHPRTSNSTRKGHLRAGR